MTKITADHLGRGAFVYIRQSTADQLLNNPESRHRQYGLADRARQLGWTTVELIDMISAAREAASIDRASSVCWPRFVRGGSAPSLRSRRRGWPATVVTGIR